MKQLLFEKQQNLGSSCRLLKKESAESWILPSKVRVSFCYLCACTCFCVSYHIRVHVLGNHQFNYMTGQIQFGFIPLYLSVFYSPRCKCQNTDTNQSFSTPCPCIRTSFASPRTLDSFLISHEPPYLYLFRIMILL